MLHSAYSAAGTNSVDDPYLINHYYVGMMIKLGNYLGNALANWQS